MTVYQPPLYLHSLIDQPGVNGAANTYVSVFNPANSGKIMGGVNTIIQPYAIGAASTAESITLHRITAASGGTLVSAATVNRFNPAHPNPTMQVRVNNPTVTLSGLTIGGTAPAVGAGLGTNAALSVAASPGAPLICPPGNGICFRTNNADTDMRFNLSFFWIEIG